jgi:2-methylcitrate dehydratase
MAYPIDGWARIVVPGEDGQRLEAEVDTPKGDPKNPLTWDELAGKFRGCAAGILPEDRIENAILLVGRLDEMADIHELISIVGDPRL